LVTKLEWFWIGKQQDPAIFSDAQLMRLFNVTDGRDRLVITCLSPSWHCIRLLNEFLEFFGDCSLSRNFPWLRFTLSESPELEDRMIVGSRPPASLDTSLNAIHDRWQETKQIRDEIEAARLEVVE
jgi:hypothetical protein